MTARLLSKPLHVAVYRHRQGAELVAALGEVAEHPGQGIPHGGERFEAVVKDDNRAGFGVVDGLLEDDFGCERAVKIAGQHVPHHNLVGFQHLRSLSAADAAIGRAE
jgi:hypothetical protein